MTGDQFRGAIETLRVLPWRLPQLPQRSFRSRSSGLVKGSRRAGAAWGRCGSAFRRRHRSRRSFAGRVDHRAGWHSAAVCSVLFHSTTAMAKGTDEQHRRVDSPVGRRRAGSMTGARGRRLRVRGAGAVRHRAHRGDHPEPQAARLAADPDRRNQNLTVARSCVPSWAREDYSSL
jgi:hypothetical protein